MSNTSESLDVVVKAKELEIKGKYQEADNILSSAIKQAQKFKEPTLAALFNQRGIIRRMLERYDDSFKDYQSTIRVNPSDPQKALAYINMADIYRVAKSDFGNSHNSLDEALTYTENGSLIHAKAVDQRGLVLLAQKDYDSAIKSHKRAREICEEILQSNPEHESTRNRFAQIVHHLGVAYVLSGNSLLVGEAYQSQIDALQTFTKLGDQQGIVNVVSALGEIAMIKNDPSKAIKQYKKAEDILKKTDYKRGITGLALSLGEAYLAKKKPEKATHYLQRFSSGVLNKEITDHDIGLIKDKFNKVYDLYVNSGLKIKKFDKIKTRFN